VPKNGQIILRNVLSHLPEATKGHIIASLGWRKKTGWRKKRFAQENSKEPSPMRFREQEADVQWNWIAIFSYTASLAVSVAIWRSLFLAVERLIK
jgi:hypothetical protein